MWSLVKSNPHLRSILAQALYYGQGNQRRIQGVGNQIQIQTTSVLPYLKQVEIEIQGDHNQIYISPGVHLHRLKIQINGSHNQLVLADRCQMRGGCLWMADDRGQIAIGAGTTIADANIGIADPDAIVRIGSDCMLSHGIDIRCGDSHTILDLTTQERINLAHRIEIKDHVWLGMYARVLKDVQIGEHSIIAAGAIVTQSIPAHCIAAGIPARVKREQVTWLREKVSSSGLPLPQKQTSILLEQTSSQT